MSFRIQGKNIFLTYPQCDIDKERLLSHLINLRPTNYCVVSSETHQDGSPHLHAVVSYIAKINVRNERFFDLDGFHPNIQTCRSIKDTITYVKKDGNYCEHGQLPSENESWSSILDSSTSKDEFLRMVRQRYPRDYVVQHDRLLAFADRHFVPPVPVYVPEFSEATFTNIPPEMDHWRNFVFSERRPQTLHLYGRSRTGKTEWARSLGPHMYFNGYFNYDEWNPNVDYIIFDDVPWERMPAKKSFFGAQQTFVITDKYRPKKTVQWGKPMIFITNYDNNPFTEMNGLELLWYKDNMIQVEVVDPLY